MAIIHNWIFPIYQTIRNIKQNLVTIRLEKVFGEAKHPLRL